MTLGTGTQRSMSASRRKTARRSLLPSFSFLSAIHPKLLLPALVLLGITIAFALYGGNPAAGYETAFVIGVAALVLFIAVFALVSWHLLLRPLPAGHATVSKSILNVGQRRFMAMLISLSTINLMVGGMWDEAWHRTYGVPLGEDFFWIPHILIYSMILFNVVVGFGGLFYLLWRGKGTLQQRFRADLIAGMLILASGFMLFAVPADPTWHAIYGEDISGFSIPHLLLEFGFTSTFLMCPALLLSTLPLRKWGGLRNLSLFDIAPIVAYSSMLNFLLQLFTTDWYSVGDAAVPEFLMRRPEWLLTAIIVASATIVATLANHSMRRYGTATIIGVATLLMRAALLALFSNTDVNANTNSWMVALIPMIAVDILYGLSVIRRKRPPNWRELAVAASFGLLLALPIVNELFVHPQIGAGNFVGVVVTGLISAAGGCWFGTELGNYLGTENKQLDTQPAAAPTGVRRVFSLRMGLPAALVLLLLVILFLIQTTPPPVLGA